MISVLLIEDEIPAAERLSELIKKIDPQMVILDVLDSIENALDWFSKNAHPQIVFMDIHLSDGSSFEILKEVAIQSHLIFVTAFDQYAVNAFRFSSVDYLLKPIHEAHLSEAIEKCKNLTLKETDFSKLLQALQEQNPSPKKSRFVVKKKDQLIHISMEEIAYFISEHGISFLIGLNGERYPIDYSLDQLSELVPKNQFIRVNRKTIIHIKSLVATSNWFNGRLKLTLMPQPPEDIIVSRDRVVYFKSWLEN
ncbi:MAG: LytR/AlgR family response regulator transcription factor [Fluviicola sp.]